MKDIFDLKNSPQFITELNADSVKTNFSRTVNDACFSFVETKQPKKPELVHLSTFFLKELNLEVKDNEQFTRVFSGSERFNDFPPYSMCYGGHQFGNWAGQLGDGRAINIAELDINGENWKFQLKGSGPTPYSRNADGLAVLRSSIREYLCSEAMYHLGVPTTRALSLIKTGDLVPRDMLYNGNVQYEQGAIVCRVSPSFIRFGSFQIFTSRRDFQNLKELVDFTLKHHFPQFGAPSKQSYLSFFEEVVKRTKEMIIHWQRVGFVHGVMNTDNMSILGLTIDYGPYGWLENYDPNWTPNTTDAQYRRYQYGNQHEIALWNLTQLANAIYPLIEEVEPLQNILLGYKTSYQKDYHAMMLSKLGLYRNANIPKEFVEVLLKLLEKSEIDMTIFFRSLSTKIGGNFLKFLEIVTLSSYLENTVLDTFKTDWNSWFEDFVKYLKDESLADEVRFSRMNLINPKYVLRNYISQLVIDEAENENYLLLDEIYQLLQHPYDEQPEKSKWFAKRPDWAINKVGCSMLSCSS